MEISGKSFHLRFTFARFMSNLWLKLWLMAYRVLDYLKWLPQRTGRLLRHLMGGPQQLIALLSGTEDTGRPRGLAGSVGRWWFEFLLYTLECLGIGELYETTLDLVKFNTRALYPWEVQLARSVYGDSIHYRRVRIDEFALAGPRQKRFCYVSFYIVNSWGPMENALLLHELVHVWQYERYGAIYMPRSIRAQGSAEGYDYGGVEGLRAFRAQDKGFRDFNFEQQGDIVADYYRIREGYRPCWGNGDRSDLKLYEHFIGQLNSA